MGKTYTVLPRPSLFDLPVWLWIALSYLFVPTVWSQTPDCDPTLELSGILFPQIYQATDLIMVKNATVMDDDQIELHCQHEISLDTQTAIYGSATFYIDPCPNFHAYRDVIYDTIPEVDPNLLSLDIYTPKMPTELLPVVIYLHGGGWNSGDKKDIALKPTFFTNQGYIFISVNYRLSPNPSDTSLLDAIRFPDHAIDVANAMGWIEQNIHLYGGDKTSIALTGHSAGAQIAALLLTNPIYLSNTMTAPAISCSCMLDAVGYNVPVLISNETPFSYTLQSAIGNNPVKWTEASPAFQITNHPSIGKWLIISQPNGILFHDQSAIMMDSLNEHNYIDVPHETFELNHTEIDLYVGIEDTSDFNQLLQDHPTLVPSVNAYSVALEYTDRLSTFFSECFNESNENARLVSSSSALESGPRLSENAKARLD